MRTVTLLDGTALPVLGQGTYQMGLDRSARAAEVAAVRLGIELGLTCIDTAEIYGDGGAEEVVAEAIAGQRDRAFVVSKVAPKNSKRERVPLACEASLRRLRIDLIDLYLLHWLVNTPLEETVEALEKLRAEGKIRLWGVSNLDVAEMEKLEGKECAANQVLYHPEERGIEFDLLPWCQERGIPVLAYSPLGQAGSLLKYEVLREIAREHDATPAQIALAWGLRQPGVISIPKAATPEHIRSNAAALDLRLTRADLDRIDAAFPPPNEKKRLVIW